MHYSLTNILLENVSDNLAKEIETKVRDIVKTSDKIIVDLTPHVTGEYVMGKIRFRGKDDIEDSKFQQVIKYLESKDIGIMDSDSKYDYDEERHNFPYIKFKMDVNNTLEESFNSEDEIRANLKDYGSEEEINQYLDSLEFTGEEFDTLDDYVEDFQLYIADKSL
jgi:hypothetical protein